MHRIYAHHGLAQIKAELPKLLSGAPSYWAAPRTATLADKLLDAFDRSAPEGLGIAVLASQRDDYEAVASDVAGPGIHTAWYRAAADIPADAEVILWDCGNWNESAVQQWGSLAHRSPRLGLALLDFPREDEVDQLRRGGFDVLGRPFLVSDLIALLP